MKWSCQASRLLNAEMLRIQPSTEPPAARWRRKASKRALAMASTRRMDKDPTLKCGARREA